MPNPTLVDRRRNVGPPGGAEQVKMFLSSPAPQDAERERVSCQFIDHGLVLSLTLSLKI